MSYVATRQVSVEIQGERVLVDRGTPLDNIDAGQIEGMLQIGLAVPAADFVADDEPDAEPAEGDADPEAGDDAQESQPDEGEPTGDDVALASLGLSQSILEALSAEGIETVGDARDYLEENPEEGFDAITGIGESSDQKIRAAIGA